MTLLVDRGRSLLDHVRVGEAGARVTGRLASYDGLMLEATGFTRPIGAGARIVSGDNQVSRASSNVSGSWKPWIGSVPKNNFDV